MKRKSRGELLQQSAAAAAAAASSAKASFSSPLRSGPSLLSYPPVGLGGHGGALGSSGGKIAVPRPLDKSLTKQRIAQERAERAERAREMEEARKRQQREQVWPDEGVQPKRQQTQQPWRRDSRLVDQYYEQNTAKKRASPQGAAAQLGLVPRPTTATAQQRRDSITPPQASKKPAWMATSNRPAEVATKDGIANLGNTCYVSAVLQALRGAPAFARRLDAFLRAHVDGTAAGGGSSSLSALRVCVELRRCLAPGSGGTAQQSLGALLRGVGHRTGAAHAGAFTGAHLRQQQDAHEFLVALLDAVSIEAGRALAGAHDVAHDKENVPPLGNLAKSPTTRDPVQETFGATLERHLKCVSCGVAREGGAVPESATVHSVTLASDLRRRLESGTYNFRLMDLLRRGVFGTEEVELKCAACSDGTTAMSRFFVRQFPETLIVHLKRFEAHAGGMRKICDPVVFGEMLDLGFADVEDGVDRHRRRYRLESVVLHHGETLHCGHYTAFVRDAASQWRFCNDLRTRGAELREVLCPRVFRMAYLLVYTSIHSTAATAAPSSQ